MTPFERAQLWAGTVLVTATGVVYGWMKYFARSDDPFAVVNHPWQPALHALHIVTAPVLVFALGGIAVRHAWWHWRRGTPAGRRSGLTGFLMIVPMILSGYLVQVLTGERIREASVWAHLGTSGLFVAAFAAHFVLMRRRLAAGAVADAGDAER